MLPADQNLQNCTSGVAPYVPVSINKVRRRGGSNEVKSKKHTACIIIVVTKEESVYSLLCVHDGSRLPASTPSLHALVTPEIMCLLTCSHYVLFNTRVFRQLI